MTRRDLIAITKRFVADFLDASAKIDDAEYVWRETRVEKRNNRRWDRSTELRDDEPQNEQKKSGFVDLAIVARFLTIPAASEAFFGYVKADVKFKEVREKNFTSLSNRN